MKETTSSKKHEILEKEEHGKEKPFHIYVEYMFLNSFAFIFDPINYFPGQRR